MTEATKQEPLATSTAEKSVFKTLLAIPVCDLTKKKGALDYIPWNTAWRKVCEVYPDATYEYKLFGRPDGSVSDVMYYPNGTGAVFCTVTIEDIQRTVIYDITKHAGNTAGAIANPDAKAINKARQRALVKCLAMHGFGMAVYERCDDYSESDDVTHSLPAEVQQKLERYDDLKAFAQNNANQLKRVLALAESQAQEIERLKVQLGASGTPEGYRGEQPNAGWVTTAAPN